MRKTAITLLALGLVAALAASASATVFYTESFTYPDGPLGATPPGTINGTTGWVTHSSTLGGSASDIQVVSGVAVGSMSNAPDDSRPFFPSFSDSTGSAAVTYSCMKVTITASAALTAGPVYMAHFKDNNPTGTVFSAKIFIGGIAGNATQYNVGISNGPANTPVMWASPLNVGQQYIFATRFDASTGVATLWVNPANESSTSVSGTDAGGAGRSLGAYGFRQSTANWGYKIDDLSVGTSFSETCGGPTPTTTGTWGRLKTLYR